jgi:putative transposase
VEESYTTKTCGCCGKINTKVGGSSTFNCEKSGYKEDRDVNGARNIWIKTMTEHGVMTYAPKTIVY